MRPAPVRIGVAIGIPEPWGSVLDRARAQAGDPQAALISSHLTLLGPTDVDSGDLPAIEAHLAAVATASSGFELELRGTGTFRPVSEVVFVAVADGAVPCQRLASAVRAGPVALGPARFGYHPHVTVAHDLDSAALDAAFERLSGFHARFEVDLFTLYVHGPDGRWQPIRDFPLTGSTPTGSTSGST